MEESEKDSVTDVLRRLSTPIEALNNLNWLILHESADADKVRLYAEIGEQQLSKIGEMILENDERAKKP